MAAPHAHSDHDVAISAGKRRLLVIVMVPLLLAIAAGMVALWPGRIETDELTAAVRPDAFFDAKVTGIERGPCEGTQLEDDITCTTATVRLQEGPDDGSTIVLPAEADVGGARLERGETIVLAYYPDAGEGFEYAYADRERRPSLLVLAGVFAIAVVALGRWKGLRALAGVGVSLAILAAFILPAILDGTDPTLVALVGGGAIAVIALYLAHGINAGSTIALIGAFASLGLVGALAWAFVEIAGITGRGGDEIAFLQVAASQVKLQGLVLAGIVIGTLGVLDDVTVLQVSAVAELRLANPSQSRWDVYRAALRIGRDHIASTVNTLVLAYAGASLPLFLLFTQAHQALSDTANFEVVAVEIVRTLVGSIGLVASVPITTVLAVWVLGGDEQRVAHDDPRRYRSRAERDIWEEAAEAPPPPDRAL